MLKRFFVPVVVFCLAVYLPGCPQPMDGTMDGPASLESIASALLFGFDEFDLDSDDALGFPEARAGHADITQDLFDQIDANADGMLSIDELQAITGTTCGTCQTETFMLPDGVPLKVIGIPAGSFMMGSINGDGDESPVHEVTLTRAFQLGETEVTKAQWTAVMGTAPWADVSSVIDDPDSPAVFVSWNDVDLFIQRLNEFTGLNFRLPTEAEWEYACRAGTTTRYYSGDSTTNLSEYAWFAENADDAGERYAHVVGQLLPNNFQLFDMHGNVAEWCADWYSVSYYSNSPLENPTGPTDATDRITRGGSWGSGDANCRSADRASIAPTTNSSRIGFRIAR